MMGTGEIVYEKGYASPQRPPKISCRHNWMKELGSEVAGSGENSKQTRRKPKIQLLEQGDLFRQSNHPVQMLRKSTNVTYLTAKAPT